MLGSLYPGEDRRQGLCRRLVAGSRPVTPQQLLDFEARHPERTRSKETAIRAELGMKPALYFVLLARAAESPEGMAYDPIAAARVRARNAAARAA